MGRLKRTGVFTGLLVLGATIALGQYSGTYTIMPSGGDFASHAEAADSLMTYGVVGPCTLLMYTCTYTGQAYFANAPWDSVEVMFKAAPGESVAVEYTSYPWYIYYTDNITVDGINTTVTSSTYGYYIYYSSGTTVRNQDINAYYGAYNYRSNSTTVENCDINASYYGWYSKYSDSMRAIGNRIRAGTYGIYSYYSGYRYFVGNNITAGSSYGIYAYRNASGSYSYYDTLAVNMMNGTTYGIYHYYHRNSYVYGNTFYGGTYAYYDYHGYDEEFYTNIFLSGGTYPLYKSGGGPPAGCDYNCYWPDPRPAYHLGQGPVSHDLREWYTEQDSHSIYRDPLVGGPTNLHLRAGSPCVDSGLAIARFPLDIDGDTIRNGVRDIGADEWLRTGRPMSGVFYIHPNPDSGDFVSFREAWDQIGGRGFGGDITLRAYSGTYEGDLDFGSVGNVVGSDTHQFTMEAVEGETPIIQATGSSSPAVKMTDAHNVKFQGLTLNGHYGLRMHCYYRTEGCGNCSIIGNNINGSHYGAYIRRGKRNVLGGNKIITDGYDGLLWSGDSTSHAKDNKIYNNMIVSTYSQGYGAYFSYHDSLALVNNSMYGEWHYGLRLSRSPHCQVKNNIVYNRRSPPYFNVYFNFNEALESDYNCWWNEDTANPRRVIMGMTLAEWQDSTGLDSNSIAADPMFVSVADLHLQAVSPCIDTGLAMVWIPYDIDGDLRDSSPDIGADEYTGPAAPMAGTYYIHPHSDSGDFVSFLEALDTLGQRGFGGDVTLSAFSGTYIGDVEIEGLGNDTFKLTLGAVEGECPVIQAEGQSSPAVSLTSARNVIIKGLTMNGYYGLRMYYAGTEGCSDCSIIGNNINGSYHGTYAYYGHDNVLAGNIIRTFGYYGLYWYGGSRSYTYDNVVCNNMIISSYGYGYGTYFHYHDGLRFLYNSLLGRWYNGLSLAHSTNCLVADNIVYGSRPSGPLAYFYDDDSLQSDYNCWWPDDSLGPVINGMTLEEWQAFSGQDSHSIQCDPLFVSETDLHLQAGSPCIDVGTPIPDITVDIDGELRDSTPCIGADEWIGTGMAEGMGKPLVVDLFRPAPNPASGPVRIRWQVPTLSRVSLKAYDISGRCVATLVDRMVETGVYVTVWHGRDNLGRRLAPGIYFYTLETGDKKLTHKVVLTGTR